MQKFFQWELFQYLGPFLIKRVFVPLCIFILLIRLNVCSWRGNEHFLTHKHLCNFPKCDWFITDIFYGAYLSPVENEGEKCRLNNTRMDPGPSHGSFVSVYKQTEFSGCCVYILSLAPFLYRKLAIFYPSKLGSLEEAANLLSPHVKTLVNNKLRGKGKMLVPEQYSVVNNPHFRNFLFKVLLEK